MQWDVGEVFLLTVEQYTAISFFFLRSDMTKSHQAIKWIALYVTEQFNSVLICVLVPWKDLGMNQFIEKEFHVFNSQYLYSFTEV